MHTLRAACNSGGHAVRAGFASHQATTGAPGSSRMPDDRVARGRRSLPTHQAQEKPARRQRRLVPCLHLHRGQGDVCNSHAVGPVPRPTAGWRSALGRRHAQLSQGQAAKGPRLARGTHANVPSHPRPKAWACRGARALRCMCDAVARDGMDSLCARTCVSRGTPSLRSSRLANGAHQCSCIT